MSSHRGRRYRRAGKLALCGASAWLLAPVAAALYVCFVAVVFELLDRLANGALSR